MEMEMEMEMQMQMKMETELNGFIYPANMNRVIVAALGFATVSLWAIFGHKDGRRQPPGPKALPIIGHFHLLTDTSKPLHQILSSLSAKYGPIINLRFGSQPVLVISSSELAKQCYSRNDLAFTSRPQLAQGKHLGYDYYVLGWAPYGAYWRNVRQICVVELLSSKRIHFFHPKRTREISKAINSLFQQGLDHNIINMSQFFFQLTFNLLLGMIIGDQSFGDDSTVSYAEMKRTIEESFVLHGTICIRDYIPWLKRFDLQGQEKAMKIVQRKLDCYLQRIVEKHREKNSNKDEDQLDFIDVLISEEKDEAISDKDAFQLLLAGTDTSSVTLEWALSLLLCHPNKLKNAQDELDSIIGQKRVVEESDIGQLKYLQAIVKETLRLYPAGPLLLPHQSTEACTVGGLHIPPGTTFMMNAWAIHRDEKVWSKPLEFIPERLMEVRGERGVGNIYNMENECEMIPFGAGRRGCPGVSLAMTTMHITLARLLQGFNWSVPDGQVIDMNEGVGISMPRAVPLKVIVESRLPH
ncbi:hypothetical protein KI387_002492, partial [Taxus chinensis]